MYTVCTCIQLGFGLDLSLASVSELCAVASLIFSAVAVPATPNPAPAAAPTAPATALPATPRPAAPADCNKLKIPVVAPP